MSRGNAQETPAPYGRLNIRRGLPGHRRGGAKWPIEDDRSGRRGFSSLFSSVRYLCLQRPPQPPEAHPSGATPARLRRGDSNAHTQRSVRTRGSPEHDGSRTRPAQRPGRPPPVTPPRNEAAGPTRAASAAPRQSARAPSITATIPTTTTLEATPSPVLYPQQVHLVATVTPAPQIFNGFLPAASSTSTACSALPQRSTPPASGRSTSALRPAPIRSPRRSTGSVTTSQARARRSSRRSSRCRRSRPRPAPLYSSRDWASPATAVPPNLRSRTQRWRSARPRSSR